nr:MFS transporter [Mycoplasmopsis felis]
MSNFNHSITGGFLANKFSSKWLLFIAVFSTGIITIWFGFNILYSSTQSPDSLFIQYAIIWGLWGVSSTLVFWTPLWKLVSQQTTKENQGLAYGIQGTANGIIGFFLIFVLGLLVKDVWFPTVSKESSTIPFATYAFLIAGFLVATSFLVLFGVPEKQMEKNTEKLTFQRIKNSVLQVYKALKNWKLWALSIFVMGMYTFQSVFAYYLLQLLQNAYLNPAILVTIIGGVRTYALRTAVSTFVGRWADKFRSYVLFLIITLGIGIIIVGSIILLGYLPESQNITLIVLSSTLYILAGVLSWGMVTLRYAQVGEIHIEKNSYASSVAVLSFIGFSTDAWLYNVTGAVGKAYTPEGATNTSVTGYQIILLITLSIALVGLLAGLAVHIANTNELKKLGKTNYRWRTLENLINN